MYMKFNYLTSIDLIAEKLRNHSQGMATINPGITQSAVDMEAKIIRKANQPAPGLMKISGEFLSSIDQDAKKILNFASITQINTDDFLTSIDLEARKIRGAA